MTNDISCLFSSSNCFENVNLDCPTKTKSEQNRTLSRLFSKCMNWLRSIFISTKETPKVIQVICHPPTTEIELPKETKEMQKRLPIVLVPGDSNPALDERAKSKDIRTRYVTFMLNYKDNQYVDYGYGMSKFQSL